MSSDSRIRILSHHLTRGRAILGHKATYVVHIFILPQPIFHLGWPRSPSGRTLFVLANWAWENDGKHLPLSRISRRATWGLFPQVVKPVRQVDVRRPLFIAKRIMVIRNARCHGLWTYTECVTVAIQIVVSCESDWKQPQQIPDIRRPQHCWSCERSRFMKGAAEC